MLEEEFLEAVVKGDAQRVVRLLGQITDIGPVKDGRNALHLAAQYGNTDIVSVLLLSGLYDSNAPDSIGYTALQIAAAEGHLEIVRQLIKNGADVNSADKVHGNTAIHEASWKGFSRTVGELAKTKIDLNVKNWGGFTPLHLCCQNGHNQSCRELLLAGCDADVQNNYGDTPLHTSARYGHAGVMRILISASCRISDQNKNGDTALHIAAAMNRRKLTRILLESKCDKNVKNKQNETPDDIAVRKNLQEILNILRSTTTASPTIVTSHKPSTKTKLKKADKRPSKVHFSKGIGDASHKEFSKKDSVPWSPYGCHYYPDAEEFPEPRLDSLPNEPLKKGEQYYLDLAGNIRKGPVGVGYACYCAPFFHELETRIEKKTNKLRKQLHRTEDAINKRLDTVEYCLKIQTPSSSNREHERPSAARSLESIFDGHGLTIKPDCGPKSSNDESRFYPSNLDSNGKDLWRSTRVNVDSGESSDEDCEKVKCNDSGYSTKMCSNSQGPSPSLSGRLESDGLLSIAHSNDEQRTFEMSNSYMSTFKNMSLKEASIV